MTAAKTSAGKTPTAGRSRSRAPAPETPAEPGPPSSAQPVTTPEQAPALGHVDPEPTRPCTYCRRQVPLSGLVPFTSGMVCADSTGCELHVRQVAAGPMPAPQKRTCSNCATRQPVSQMWQQPFMGYVCRDSDGCWQRAAEAQLGPVTEAEGSGIEAQIARQLARQGVPPPTQRHTSNQSAAYDEVRDQLDAVTQAAKLRDALVIT